MSAFLFKGLSVATKSLARPLINYLAYYNRIKLQESNIHIFVKLKDGLIFLGQKFNYYSIVFNRKMFKLSTKTPIHNLTPEKALERGAELISEFIVYSFLITFSTLEIIKSHKKSTEKEKQKNENLMKMRYDLFDIIDDNYEILKDLKVMKKSLNDMNNKIYIV